MYYVWPIVWAGGGGGGRALQLDNCRAFFVKSRRREVRCWRLKPLLKTLSAAAPPQTEGRTKAKREITQPARQHRSHFSPRSTLSSALGKTRAACSSTGRASMCETVETARIDLSTWNAMHRSNIGECNQWKPARYCDLDVSVRKRRREAGKTHVSPSKLLGLHEESLKKRELCNM